MVVWVHRGQMKVWVARFDSGRGGSGETSVGVLMGLW